MSRYARQELVSGVGDDGQRMLSGASVLVVGAGGLGVPVLQYLTGAGVGRITLADDDVVEEGNLHRQPLYRPADIGQLKVQAGARALRELNPEVELLPVARRLDPSNVYELLQGCSLVLDCGDNFAVSYTLSDACHEAGLPLISASALGMEAYVGGFCGGAPSLRALFPELPEQAGSCSTAGILGPVVAAAGTIQAQMAMSVLLGMEPSPLGCLLTFDARSWRTSSIRFNDAAEPAGRLLRFVGVNGVGSADVVIDLRAFSRAEDQVAPHALHMGVDDAAGHLSAAAGAPRVVFCCRTGVLSWRAARALQSRWPGEVVVLATGDQPQQSTASTIQ